MSVRFYHNIRSNIKILNKVCLDGHAVRGTDSSVLTTFVPNGLAAGFAENKVFLLIVSLGSSW